jgi:Cu/Ag efflux protein CusF
MMRLAGVVVCLLTIACSHPAPLEKKSYTFRGKVEAVDKNARNLKVNGENVAGWMGAMTMDYKVDDPSVFDVVKPGDQITATVYDGDEILHKVEIVDKATDSKSK